MKNRKNTTKKALLMSVLSMLLCCTMLIGTTFAWFTDTVTTGTNRIVAGNLDVELYYKNASTDNKWEDAKAVPEKAPTFFVDKDGNDILWEPGVMAITEFKVENAGTLALKYELVTKISDKNTVTVGDDEHDLSEVISFAVVKGEFDKEKYATRDSILADEDIEFKGFAAFEAKNDLLEPEKDDIFTVIAYWKPNDNDVDNIYNINNGKLVSGVNEAADPDNHLWIDIDINLLATQTPYEEDSFGTDYDEDATIVLPDAVVTNTASLIDAVKEVEPGAVIQLEAGTYENVGTLTVDKDLTLIGKDGAIINDAVVEIKESTNVVVKNIDFAGDSYIHNQGMKSLTMKDCEVDVNVPKNVNNGRAAFISLGSSETTYGVKLDIQDNTFKVKSDADSYVAAVFGWAYIEDNSVIRGNTFGSEDSRYTFIAVKLMNFVDGAAITISENTVYGTIDSWDFYAFDLFQNNSRANKYNADFSGNTVNVTGEKYEGCFLCLESNGVGSATVNIGGTNTYNGQTVTEDNCDIEGTAGIVNFIIVDEGDFEDPFS